MTDLNLEPENQLRPLTPAEQMLPNPHIITLNGTVDLNPAVETTHIAAINTEITALKEGTSPEVLPLYSSALLLAESVRKHTSDKLTGLLNREGLIMWLERNKPAKFAVFFSDARKFKEVNDTHGHNIGDKVINYIGNEIATKFRIGKLEPRQAELRINPDRKDAVAGIGRWGGDEVLTIVDLTDIEEGKEQEIIDNMKLRLDDFGNYTDPNDPNIVIPISIRSAALFGRATDNRDLTSYQTELDNQLIQLKATEKAA